MFTTFQSVGIFKSGHLSALSGINPSTLKYYLRYLHQLSNRKTEKRKASRFTGLEAMAVILMAELQREWDIKPEKSFATAYWASGHFVYEFQERQAGRGNPEFPKHTFTAAFDSERTEGVIAQSGATFIGEFADRLPSYRLAAVVFADQRIYEIAFEPVVDQYYKLTGVDLILDDDKEGTS